STPNRSPLASRSWLADERCIRPPHKRPAIVTNRTASTDVATPTSAIMLVIAAFFLFSMLDASAKYLVLSGLEPPFVAWVRFAVHLVLVLILFRGWSNPLLFRSDAKMAQFLRGLFLFGSTIFNFFALQSLQLAQTVSIGFFGPMLVTALAGPFLGEWAGWRRWMAVLVGFVGVLVI